REAVDLTPELVAERDLIEQHEAVRPRTLPQEGRIGPGLVFRIGHDQDAEAPLTIAGGIDDGHATTEGADRDRGPAAELHARPALELQADGSALVDQRNVVAVDPELDGLRL